MNRMFWYRVSVIVLVVVSMGGLLILSDESRRANEARFSELSVEYRETVVEYNRLIEKIRDRGSYTESERLKLIELVESVPVDDWEYVVVSEYGIGYMKGLLSGESAPIDKSDSIESEVMKLIDKEVVLMATDYEDSDKASQRKTIHVFGFDVDYNRTMFVVCLLVALYVVKYLEVVENRKIKNSNGGLI